jgi:PAS domain S-box-containing protein
MMTTAARSRDHLARMPSDPDELDALRERVRVLERENAELEEQCRVNALYRAAVERAPIALGISDAEGVMLAWNDAMLAVSGFAPSEVERWKAARETAAARALRARMLAVVRERGKLASHPISIPGADSVTREVVTDVAQIEIDQKAHLHVTMQDVSELRRVGASLHETELRFNQVVGALRQVIYLTAGDRHTIQYVSPSLAALWGRDPQQMYDDPYAWLQSLHPDDRDRVAADYDRPWPEGRWSGEYRIIRGDGAVRWMLDTAYEHRDKMGVVRVVGVVDDITDRRRLEAQLRESQKLEAIGQLAGGVAHDFNNLITSILGNVAMLSTRTDRDELEHEQLADVAIAANRAAALTKKLLGFSRRTLLSLGPVDMRAIARETAALLRSTLDPRITIVVEEPAELGVVLADAGEMSQVLMNLCLNARDAMPEGGKLTISVCERTLTEEDASELLDARDGEVICVSVEDEGVGIASDVRDRIFEPFFTTKEPGSGTGLGLAMVFGIVKQHEGWIDCTSELGKRTRFSVCLPKYTGLVAPAAPAEGKPKRETSSERVLFVDDEPALRKLASVILADRGYRVIVAEDGHEALRIFESEWRSIDLVVLDLRMPRLSGRETLQQIWRIDPFARVLVSSGHADEHDRIASSEPIAGSLSKPYDVEELAEAVRAALDKTSD